MTCSINGYPIEVTRQYRPHYSSKTTNHPVEKGSNFTDNIQANPFEFTMDCVISNTPIGAIATDATRQGSNPAKDAWDNFVAVWEARQPITVVAPDGTYTNVALVDLVKTMDANSHGGIVFTAQFEKIVIITNNRTTVRTALSGGGGQNHKGDRQAITLDPSSTWVISIDSSNRARATKVYGPPLVQATPAAIKKGNSGVTTDDGQGTTSTSFVTYDRYKVDPQKITPDGYVDKQGTYTPYKFDPTDGKFHSAPSLFNGPNDNPLNAPRTNGNTTFDKPNNIGDYLKNGGKPPPAQPAANNQPQTGSKSPFSSLFGGS